MLTDLGKELRKFRIDHDVTLLTMAASLGLSASMLSSVETGKKPAPASLTDRLLANYPELAPYEKRLRQFAAQTRPDVRIAFGTNDRANAWLVELSQQFETLTPVQLEALARALPGASQC